VSSTKISIAFYSKRHFLHLPNMKHTSAVIALVAACALVSSHTIMARPTQNQAQQVSSGVVHATDSGNLSSAISGVFGLQTATGCAVSQNGKPTITITPLSKTTDEFKAASVGETQCPSNTFHIGADGHLQITGTTSGSLGCLLPPVAGEDGLTPMIARFDPNCSQGSNGGVYFTSTDAPGIGYHGPGGSEYCLVALDDKIAYSPAAVCKRGQANVLHIVA
jgi:hypothetical protein